MKKKKITQFLDFNIILFLDRKQSPIFWPRVDYYVQQTQ